MGPVGRDKEIREELVRTMQRWCWDGKDDRDSP